MNKKRDALLKIGKKYKLEKNFYYWEDSKDEYPLLEKGVFYEYQGLHHYRGYKGSQHCDGFPFFHCLYNKERNCWASLTEEEVLKLNFIEEE